MLTTNNLWTENGLMNGTMGTVEDISWGSGQDPATSMPSLVFVKYDEYKGPEFPGLWWSVYYHCFPYYAPVRVYRALPVL
jgi:hypothetical protein